jgi:arsenate reductase
MTGAFPITVFHNPACGTSRNVLAVIIAAGHSPEVIEYLKAGWTRAGLEKLLTAMKLGPRDILRTKGALAGELGLLEAGVSNDRVLDAMVAHPILVERPIVVTPVGARVCRPVQTVLSLLDRKPA